MLNAYFTRKDRRLSSKALLYHTYVLFQMCTALAAPNTADLAHPTEAGNVLNTDTPLIRSDADGQLNRRQVRSRLSVQTRLNLMTGQAFEGRSRYI